MARDGKVSASLAAIMAARGLAKRDVARASGLSESAVGRYVSGEREPTSSALVALADGLGVTTDALLGRSVEDGAFEEAISLVGALGAHERTELAIALLKAQEREKEGADGR